MGPIKFNSNNVTRRNLFPLIENEGDNTEVQLPKLNLQSLERTNNLQMMNSPLPCISKLGSIIGDNDSNYSKFALKKLLNEE